MMRVSFPLDPSFEVFPNRSAKMLRLATRLLSTLLLGVLLISCGGEEEAPKKHEKASAKVPVELPPKPNLDSILGAPRTLPDGSMTVTGLILDKNQHFGQRLKVRGVVRDVSPDCPFLTDPAEKENRPKLGGYKRMCKSVYLTIADNPVHPKELLLVEYNPYLHPHLKPGDEIIAYGLYDIKGAGFVRPKDGLMVVEDVLNLAVDAEGKFYNLPEDVARVRAEQAAAEAAANQP